MHPTPHTCDQQWPVAPWYLQVPSGKDGNEACLDGTAHTEAQISVAGEATLQLIWLPPCHAYYATATITDAQISKVCIAVVEAASGRRAEAQQSSGQSEVNLVYSPLLFSDHGPALAVATLVSNQSTILLHTPGLPGEPLTCS